MKEAIENLRDEFNAAIDFALDQQNGDPNDADTFLRLWREGDWATITRDWPDWNDFRAQRGLAPKQPGNS